MKTNEVKELAERLRASGVPTHFEEGKARLLISVWRLVAQGQPVSKNEIKKAAKRLGGSVEEAMSFIEQISERDDDGNVVGIFGLSQREHPHKFILDSSTFSTWCAWDALFLPPMLKQKVRIETQCPQTKDKITVLLGPDGVESFTPNETVLSIVLPGSGKTTYESVEQAYWPSFRRQRQQALCEQLWGQFGLGYKAIARLQQRQVRARRNGFRWTGNLSQVQARYRSVSG